MMLYGIDLSQHNRDVNFKELKDAGNSFVILRAGYGWDISQKDPCFDEYYIQARAARLKVGAYHYSYARNEEEARMEAECFLKWVDGKKFDFPLFLDMEDADGWKRANGNPSGETLAAVSNAFLRVIEKAGYYTGIYASASWFDGYLKGLDPFYDHWIASWGRDDGDIHGSFEPMHQYTSNYILNGKRYDRSICYVDYPAIISAYKQHRGKEPVKTADLFAAKVTGNAYDIDGYYGAQCWDGAMYYSNWLGYPAFHCSQSGYVKDIWNLRHQSGILRYYAEVQRPFQDGDIIIFGECAQTPLSHIGIFRKDNKDGTFILLGQNQGGYNGAFNQVKFTYDGVLGGLRPRSFIDANHIPTDPPKPKPDPIKEQQSGSVYRMYNPHTGDHLYTTNVAEANQTQEGGWKYEGVAWISPLAGKPVYRMLNPNGCHHFTPDKAEVSGLEKLGWCCEGIGFYSGGNHSLYRMYNPNSGAHVLTASNKEHDELTKLGWKCELSNIQF